MKDIDIVFVDIDCTLLNHSTRPPVYDFDSISALKEAQSQGVLVFLCTARPYHSVKRIGLFDLFQPDGMILANGGLALYGDKVLYETAMDPKDFEKFCEVALSVGARLTLYLKHIQKIILQ